LRVYLNIRSQYPYRVFASPFLIDENKIPNQAGDRPVPDKFCGHPHPLCGVLRNERDPGRSFIEALRIGSLIVAARPGCLFPIPLLHLQRFQDERVGLLHRNFPDLRRVAQDHVKGFPNLQHLLHPGVVGDGIPVADLRRHVLHEAGQVGCDFLVVVEDGRGRDPMNLVRLRQHPAYPKHGPLIRVLLHLRNDIIPDDDNNAWLQQPVLIDIQLAITLFPDELTGQIHVGLVRLRPAALCGLIRNVVRVELHRLLVRRLVRVVLDFLARLKRP